MGSFRTTNDFSSKTNVFPTDHLIPAGGAQLCPLLGEVKGVWGLELEPGIRELLQSKQTVPARDNIMRVLCKQAKVI